MAIPLLLAAFTLSHQPVDCVVAGRHPRFEAQSPQVEVAAARVFFKGASEEWYSVAMKPEGSALVAVLPAPKKSLKEFHYYIEAASKTLETARTADRTARIVSSPGDCRGLVAASAASAASILVQGPAGAAGAPVGFGSTGLVAAGGGISGTTLAAVGGAVGAGALAAAKLSGGDGNTEFAGPVEGQLTIVFGPCTRLERYSFTLLIELSGENAGIARTQSGAYQVVSATNCATGPQTGNSTPFGIGETRVTRSGSSLSFAYREGSGGGETQLDFQGSLQGNVITGTVTLVVRVPNLTGISVSTPMVAAVTLNRQ